MSVETTRVLVTGAAGRIGSAFVEEMQDRYTLRLADKTDRVHDLLPGAEALLVSCGGLRTLDALQPLEEATGMPVVSSFPHALWAGMALLGLPRAIAGYGTLLARG